MIAVAEAARNITVSGGQPLGVTNCLNFGNPYDPQVYYQFVNAVKGMGEACRRFETPVTGGNVSFYNQNPDGPVYPTPTIGMVGLVEDLSKTMSLNFKQEGDVVFLLGALQNDINASEYLHKIRGVEFSPAPHFELDEEFALQQKISELIQAGVLQSAHDLAEGGLIVALLESGFTTNLGFDIQIVEGFRKDAYLFGEAQSRVIVSVATEKVPAFKKAIGNLPCYELGVVTSSEVVVGGQGWGLIEEWKEMYDTAIEKLLAKEEAGGALSMI
jgi:phosphoribosylformylglycinamidine synthase